MKRALVVMLCVLGSCKDKVPEAPARPPVPEAPAKSKPVYVNDGGEPPVPMHKRPEARAGVVKKLADGTQVLSGHTEAILSVAFAADGKHVATGAIDRTVRVWDLEAGVETLLVQGSEEAVTVLRFSPDGTLLAAGDRAYQVRLLETSDGGVRRVQAHPDTISGLAFSPDGKWLGVAGSGGNAAVYELAEDAKPKCDLRGRTIDFTDDGKRVVTATPTGVLIAVDFPSCKQTKETSTSPHLPYSSASAKGELIATRNGAESFALLWDAVKGRMLGKLEGHLAGITAVQISPDGKRVITASEDRSVRLWDVETKTVLKKFQTGSLPFAVMSPDGSKLLISDGVEARVVSTALP